MRVIKLVGALTMLLALTVIAATTASAAVEFLPGAKGTAFTGESGKAILKGGGGITCKKSKTTGELLGPTEALLVTTFEGCESAGLAVNGLGDAANIIKVHVEEKNCIISETPLVGGLLLKPLPVHIEIPSVKLLILIEGDVIGLLTPANKSTKAFTLGLAAKEEKQEVRECKDVAKEASKKETLVAKVDGVEAGEGVESVENGTLTFTTVAQEFMT
jgi:hypothetical protein